jgi:hypothetical protein
MNILSIDPGYTSGVCMASTHDDFEVIQVGEFDWDERFSVLETLLTGKHAPNGMPLIFDVVITENFRLRHDKAKTQVGQTFPSSQIIGIVGYLCYKQDIPLVIQEPGTRVRVKVLDEHKYMVVGPHITDAYQHARYYYVTKCRGV